MKPTSIKAYREIKANGTLSHRKFQVFNYLNTFGPHTGKEIEAATVAGAWKRCTELETNNKIERCPARKCNITGKIALTWRVRWDGDLPLVIPKKPTRAALEAEIKLLRAVRDEQVNKLSSIYDKAHRHGFDDCYRLIKLMGIL